MESAKEQIKSQERTIELKETQIAELLAQLTEKDTALSYIMQ